MLGRLMSKEKRFQFHVPVELQKGKEEDEWRIKGIASTPDQDLQGEVVDQDGLDISLLKAGRGLFNVDHQKGPENIIGQIEDAEFIDQNGKKALAVDGYLFKHQDRAKAFYNIMRSVKKSNGPRVHLSVEGKVLARDMADTKKIKKARIEKVALTLDPVNPYTYADLCKSLAADEVGGPVQEVEVPETNAEETITMKKGDFETLIHAVAKAVVEDIRDHKLYTEANKETEVKAADHDEMATKMKKELAKIQSFITDGPSNNQAVEAAYKALVAGVGHSEAPTSRTGGAAMMTESLEKEPKKTTHEKKKKNKEVMIKSVIDGLRKAYPDHDPLELAGWVIEAFATKDLKETKSGE